jgi:hypothetical protein
MQSPRHGDANRQFLQLFVANVLQHTCMHSYCITLSHFHSPVCNDIPNLNLFNFLYKLQLKANFNLNSKYIMTSNQKLLLPTSCVTSLHFFLIADVQTNPYIWTSTCYKLYHNQRLHNYKCFSSIVTTSSSDENLKWRECYRDNGIQIMVLWRACCKQYGVCLQPLL